nr:RNA-binding protein 25-like [Ipomoea batatas]
MLCRLNISRPSDLDDQQVSLDVRFMMRAMKGEFEKVNRKFDGLAERIEIVEGELNRNQNGGGTQNRGQNGSERGSDGDNQEEVIRNPERGRHRGGVNRVIEGSDDDMGKINMAIPKFQGKNDPEAYLEWVTKVERVFECHRYSEQKRLKLAILEFSDYATILWEKVMADRTRNGEDPITSWRQLKAMMRRRFVPSWYQRELYQQLEGLVQGSSRVLEYVQEIDKLMTRLNIDENIEQSMARFHRGLNWEIKDERTRIRTQSSSSWRHRDRNNVDAKAESNKQKESQGQRDKGNLKSDQQQRNTFVFFSFDYVCSATSTVEDQGNTGEPPLPPSYLPRSSWWRRTAVAPHPAAASSATTVSGGNELPTVRMVNPGATTLSLSATSYGLRLPIGCKELGRQQTEQCQWWSAMGSARCSSPASNLRTPTATCGARQRSRVPIPLLTTPTKQSNRCPPLFPGGGGEILTGRCSSFPAPLLLQSKKKKGWR